LATTWTHAAIGPVPIHATAIDSGGHFTAAVCRFADERRGRRVLAIKGAPGPRPIWPKRESKAMRGKVYVIGVDSAKQIVSQRLKITEGSGRIHFPVTCTRAWFEQLCSEYLQTTYKRGRPERAWVRKPGRAAEAWDAAIYAYAAVHALRSHGIDVDAEVERLELVRAADRPVSAVLAEGYQTSRSKFVSRGY
jgi:phage terminase large subunit GpA-like protein